MLFSVFISTDHFIVGKVKLCLWTLWLWKEVTYLQEKVSPFYTARVFTLQRHPSSTSGRARRCYLFPQSPPSILWQVFTSNALFLA